MLNQYDLAAVIVVCFVGLPAIALIVTVWRR